MRLTHLGHACLLAETEGARILVDEDTAATVPGLPAHTVVRDGDRFRVGGTRVEVIAGLHAVVYGDMPGCMNAAYLIDDGALLHPGDSFADPGRDVAHAEAAVL